MQNEIKLLNEYFDKNEKNILEEFFTYLKFKSISTDPDYSKDVKACCNWVENYFKDLGFEVKIWVEGGHPCVFAERKVSDSSPTVLFYAHYDVQPIDPIELWTSDPFEPTIKNGEIYARGAQDDKGQSYYSMLALKSLKELNKLPKNLNIKFLIEGEEECGSKSLTTIINKHKDELKADYLYVVDSGFHSMEKPAITLGCRGIVTMTVTLTGSTTDLHSGEHGGITYNPLHALVSILAQARDSKTGKILVPNFYDKVSKISETDRKELALEFDDDFYTTLFGAKANGGETDFTPLESAWLRPTLEVNGLSGGYAGNGFKTVIPAKAVAKVSCRLVPDQDPVEIANLVIDFLKSKCPDGISIEISDLSTTGKPMRNDLNTKICKVTKEVITEVTGKTCINMLIGGSFPIIAHLAEATKSENLFIGYGLPDDQIHAPNEHFGINRLKLGHATIGMILLELDK